MKAAFYNNVEYQKLLEEFDQLLNQLDTNPSSISKESVMHILRHFDVIHREPLTRFLNFLEADYPEAVEKIKSDYTIKTLMTLYDFINDDIERDPLAKNETIGFVSEDDVRLLSNPD